jgi:polygalacturonase
MFELLRNTNDMKLRIIIALLLLTSLFLQCNTPKKGNGIYNIKDFGAKGDSSTINTLSIQRAIDACHENGGGRVLIPNGQFITGSIMLKSNVELHLTNSAKLYGSVKAEDYPHKISCMKSFSPNGIDRQEFFGLIMADGAENIAITGKGTIDGRGALSEDFRSYPTSEDGSTWHKPERPRLIMMYNSSHIKIHDVSIVHPANWANHYKRCDFLEIRGIYIYSHGNANNDGLNLDECQDVTISNIVIDADDDGLVFKSLGTRASRNIAVTNSVISSKITPIKVGTETGGDFQNITISNCIIRPSKEKNVFDPLRKPVHGAGIALEIVDGGIMDGVTISNIVIENSYAPFFLKLGNRGRKYGGEEPAPGQMRNIILDNIICRNVQNDFSSTITGFPGHYIENLTLSNIRMEMVGGTQTIDWNPMPENEKNYPWPGMFGNELPYPAYGIYFRHVKNLTLFNVQTTFDQEDIRPALHLENVENARIIYSDFEALKEAIVLKNTQNIKTY